MQTLILFTEISKPLINWLYSFYFMDLIMAIMLYLATAMILFSFASVIILIVENRKLKKRDIQLNTFVKDLHEQERKIRNELINKLEYKFTSKINVLTENNNRFAKELSFVNDKVNENIKSSIKIQDEINSRFKITNTRLNNQSLKIEKNKNNLESIILNIISVQRKEIIEILKREINKNLIKKV